MPIASAIHLRDLDIANTTRKHMKKAAPMTIPAIAPGLSTGPEEDDCVCIDVEV
jgi:hypothetical protein